MADDGFTPQVEWILRKVTGTASDDAVLGDARRRCRPPRRRYMKDPIEVAIDCRHRHRRHDAPPVPRGASHGQGPGRCCDRQRDVEDARVLPDEADVRSRRAQPAGSRCAGGGDSRRSRAGRARDGVEALHRRRACACWSPPTSPPVASTSTTSVPSSTTSRHPTEGLPAPQRPHGPRRARRLGGHARRVQPAHAGAHPAARAATRVAPPIEVFSNNPKLRNLSEF